MITIKKKLVFTLATILLVTLSALATTLFFGERDQITRDITTNAIHFAELSSDQIADLYDIYFRSQSFALFDSELQKILARDPDIARVDFVTSTGEMLFSSGVSPTEKLASLEDPQILERLKSAKISAGTAERFVFLERDKMHAANYESEDIEGRPVERLNDDDYVETIIYPLDDNTRRMIFYPSYEEVGSRLRESLLKLAGLFLVGFAASFFVASRFAGSITRPLAALRRGANKIAKGDLESKIEVKSNDETKLLADTFNQMTTDLVAAIDSKVEFERAAKEIEVASEIQTSTLPKETKISGLDLAVSFTPATEVGGDVYDSIERDGRGVFYIADATGHGVPAGMVAALTNASVAATSDSSLENIATRANEIIHSRTKPNMFITALFFEWNESKNELNYLNAGHEPALIFRAATGEIEDGERGALAIGMLPNLPNLQTRQLELNDGDFVLAFTDGINEAQNDSGEQLEIEGLKKIFAAACREAKTANEIAKIVVEKAEAWRAGVPAEDDITLLVFGRK